MICVKSEIVKLALLVRLINWGVRVPDKIKPMPTAFEFFLPTDPYFVGYISVAVTVLCLEIYASVKAEKYPKIFVGSNCVRQTVPFFDEIKAKPFRMYRQLIHDRLAKN